MMNSYKENTKDRVISIVLNGDKKSKSYSAFENWAQYGITAEQFIAVLPWLFDNDRDESGRTVKGIGLVVPHQWVGDEPGRKMLFKQTGKAEIHRITYVHDCHEVMYDEETGYLWNNVNPRYTVEDVVRGVYVNITEKAE